MKRMSAEVSKMLKKSKYTKKGDTLKETVRAAGVTMTKQFLDKKHIQELRTIRMIKDNGGGGEVHMPQMENTQLHGY